MALSASDAAELDLWADRPFLPDTPSDYDIQQWADVVETKLRDLDINPADWALGGLRILPLDGRLRTAMQEAVTTSGSSEKPGLSWTAFLERLRHEAAHLPRVGATGLSRFCENHPVLAVTAGAGLVAAGSAMVLPTAGLALAGAAGFGASGPVAGTLATTIQSAVYGAYTCGIFSVVQSFAMTATAASAPSVIAGAAAITGGSVIVKNTIDRLEEKD
ncbi:hypothetical protein BV22DRAFT_1028572 [Leucogyrophana mollusca]|uniref:Uncharacterized protein n=1 Tax=Leucogyrophana mollusca TaxID=85980 RepID=A0ACB8BXX3_9AGAM|nr:hypothetical protein BV22DRAFT_1028572 [Leucogyrophana mollusca]